MAIIVYVLAFTACENLDSPTSFPPRVSINNLEKQYFCKNLHAVFEMAKPNANDRFIGTENPKRTSEELAYSLFNLQAHASRWSLYKVKELTMANAFGRTLVSSSYQLFEGTFIHNGVEKKAYALVNRDGSLARSLRSCSEFNDLVDSLDRKPKSKPDTMLMVRGFLMMTGVSDDKDVILEEGMALDEKKLASLEKQLARRPSYRFKHPVFQKKLGKIIVSFWTWNRISGMLMRHVLKLDSKGRILEYYQERFRGKIGQTEKI